ncbi:hypothetical protein BGX26_007401 [Mortierella sp. AD094]|nr:hypothetical protein BGX26_007401 [Mortierella sp. AD094]
MRSSYSFRGEVDSQYSNLNTQHKQNRPSKRYPEKRTKRTKRIRRDLQDYPIFITGNPPDLVRLAIEFGHVPFVDHLLHQGFRPRDLPEYFSLIPLLPVVNESDYYDEDASAQVEANARELRKHQVRQASLLDRSSELNQIWECMRVANQELMDACSTADLDGVLKVLDATLVHPRLALDSASLQQQESRLFLKAQSGQYQTIINKGKQRQASYEEYHTQFDSTGSGSGTAIQALEDDVASGAGVGSSSLHQGSAAHSRNRTAAGEEGQLSEEGPNPPAVSNAELFLGSDTTTTHQSRIFQPRQRVDSEGSQNQHRFLFQISSHFQERELSESPSHMPWVDGRALTSALLAICFRRDGYESEEAEALEESKAVPIVNEILKYDCMLTAQSLGQAVLGVAYSRSPGSIRRAYDRRLRRWEKQQKQDQNSASASSRPELVPQDGGMVESSENDIDTGVMDLLMERIGPREWLKLIKCYLQRQEFDDLAIILELCPFKGQQLESKDKSVDKDHRFLGRLGPGGELNRCRQQARELICREAGICGVGSRLSQFNGRGIGQSSYNVSSTLHGTSRMLFTGSGTRFTNSYMLPRGGFRGIGGNTSGHSSSVGNNGQGVDSEESFNGTEEDSPQSTSGIESSQLNGPPQSQWQPSLDNSDFAGVGSGNESGSGSGSERGNGEGYVDGDDDDDLIAEQFGPQDSSLAFGGIGSSTTSSSRPGPGIVGIAIQVHAPEHIMSTLLKMGFRFFSICDLSISDNHHPLALQFRQQEKLNRLLIEFCMAPSPGTLLGVGTGHYTDKRWKMKAPRKRRRDEHKYDAADREYYAQAVEKFLYPAANHPARGTASIPALPSQVPDSSEGPLISITTEKTRIIESPVNSEVSLASPVEEIAPRAPISSLSPSNRLQFILPPMHLGESIESIAAAAAAADFAGGSSSQSPEPPLSATFAQIQYHRSGLAKSMPLPIKASMIEARNIRGLNLTASTEEAPGTITAYQRMLDETIKRRIREHLSSEYIDLMTVGICLYQACFHQKELVLSVLLEHRLLIAQNALSGAVQVAASVGWKRGLEILLMEHGDMEAEIDPVVTTTSDHVHNSTSVKWDHATSEPIRPVKSKFNRNTSLNSPRRTRSAGLEGFVNRGLRRHRSDGGRLNRSNSGDNDSRGGFGLGGSLRRASSQSFEATRRSSLDFTHFRAPESASPPPMLTPSVLGPIVPTTRSSSLRIRISSLLPNLSAPFSSANSTASLKLRKKQKAKQQRQQERRFGGRSTSNVTHQDSQVQKSQPSVLFLSTSGLYSLPGVMIQRKNRNAVVALMAATSRNDPSLVHWLIETFADIKIVHIMQALMIACDRGFSRVVQALVGSSVTDRDGTKTGEGDSPRLLFRQWLALQYKKILEATLLTSNTASASERHGPNQQRFDSFPFIFLMESSPIFRHYYQTLNTLSSSQFMFQKRSRNRKSLSTAGFQENGGQNNSFTETFYNVQAVNSTSSTTTPSPLRLHRRQQQQQLQQQTASSCSRPLFQPQYSRIRPRTPQETKLEITKIMLEPLLETFGSISFRKALDRMPKDCWWSLDHDVRLMVDQEARMAMVAIVTTIKRQQKAQHEQQQQKRQQEHQAQKRQMNTSKDQCQSESKTTAEGAAKRQSWNERWDRARKWATLKNRTKTGEPITTSCEEKNRHVEATAFKSFFIGFFK